MKALLFGPRLQQRLAGNLQDHPTLSLHGSFRNTSKAIQATVPAKLIFVLISFRLRDVPKSQILITSLSSQQHSSHRFYSDEVEDKIVLRNSKKGCEREKEKERREHQEEMGRRRLWIQRRNSIGIWPTNDHDQCRRPPIKTQTKVPTASATVKHHNKTYAGHLYRHINSGSSSPPPNNYNNFNYGGGGNNYGGTGEIVASKCTSTIIKTLRNNRLR
ncbi:hypothetical protein pipiens_006332 [Culex pipiens pipiens]|uniref:Uncharacterized protein n=1 Tax=Culex pipiens pipiens TaxID=38569 RepID=A0ABD1DQL1_CULPP